jgi:hypothetical protein
LRPMGGAVSFKLHSRDRLILDTADEWW